MVVNHIVLVVCVFLILRCLFALVWNSEMANISRKEKGSSYWYGAWDPTTAIFNPKHWLKWTTSQWVKYQKERFGDN